MPVVFCNDEELAAKLHTLSGSVSDQVKLSYLGVAIFSRTGIYEPWDGRTLPGRAVVAATKIRRELLSGEGPQRHGLKKEGCV